MSDHDTKRGTVDLAILATLEHQARYGLEILEEVQRATQGALSFKEGSLYPALQRLVQRKWVRASWEDSPIGGAPRKYYELTDDGRGALEDKRRQWRAVRDAMEAFLAIPAVAAPRRSPARVPTHTAGVAS